ncbi:PTS system, fructose-specific IIA/FPr component [Bibersteinia trehalosi USDA-ARS-USMARC-188]|uniref:Multiphosphoryl transfer protein n=1 Tax=Bibersteinia trehalosi USDA-ARS-USMARC-188 TaxID=1263829 RepID=A0A4V7IBH2_BIBTR|nr:fused PTS fructose transporter subunit IIA/HPr protein [Bibersteinia trehalosi]AHG82383.1 PTS system, fructose-specific IIA/FPr component [Bibersteinia trehalosi USDA-ARS-USMARC-188]
MLNLSISNISLNGSATDKETAIRLVAAGLVKNGNVAEGYENGMLARENQTSTFLGNGIAIPHGTLETRDLVKNTGVQVYQFPQGVEWGEGNIAYVVIGIAAKSDEHLALLRQLTSVLSDEQAAETLAKTANLDEFIATLSGKKALPIISAELISLNAHSESLITLSAINAGKLTELGYANPQFISQAVASQPLALNANLFVSDAQTGNVQNGIAVARSQSGKTVVSVSAVDNALESELAKLFNQDNQQILTSGTAEQILALFGVASNVVAEVASNNAEKVIGTFTLRNDNGLHARPVAELVKIVKAFDANVTVENLDRGTAPVSAKSTMKILTLGAVKGSKLRFTAEGSQALAAIEAIKAGFENGLGEPVSFVPGEADIIEQSAAQQAVENPQNSANTSEIVANNGELEATFVIRNEHGLHARPSAMLVAEAKKYNADIKVQNVDRNSDLVSAKSMMKIVALGVTKGHHLRFVASGEQAKEALEGIGKAIEAGLGE